MTRRRTTRRRSSRFSTFRRGGRARRIGSGIQNSLRTGKIGEGFKGIGGGYAGEQIGARVGYPTVGGFLGAYVTGGIPGAIGHAIRKAYEGQLSVPGFSVGGGGSNDL